MVAALGNTTLPQATFDPDTSGTTYSRAVRVPLSLNTSRMVVGLSFGWVGGSTPSLLVDPTSFEKPLLTSTISVVVDSEGGVGIETREIPFPAFIRSGARNNNFLVHITETKFASHVEITHASCEVLSDDRHR
ncbi:hypothetical protein PAXINDRAFT_158082 [Paxillus involutus ATCC 200175]|uniref:Uncharacterized protein n=1 Tax=Paxillus involutus ATCC 200175 TaxID=664439 RepID=A0A0C9SZF8_PAXIN|nr:hypothetical protein PAXINDRAFT_158082 [Paxillus involutus ATCC 200175]